jgi:hypothetical protein
MNRSAILMKTYWITAMLAFSVSAAQASQMCVGSCLIVVPPLPIAGPPPIGIIQPPPSVQSLGTALFETINGWSYNFYFLSLGIGPITNPVNSFTLPYFTDEQISSVITPSGWDFKISNIDVFNLGQGAGSMSWTYIGTPPITPNPWFGFLSPWTPGLAPFNYTQIDTTTNTGKFDLPISPLAIIYGLAPTAVPVPPALITFLSALAALTLAARHSKGKHFIINK